MQPCPDHERVQHVSASYFVYELVYIEKMCLLYANAGAWLLVIQPVYYLCKLI